MSRRAPTDGLREGQRPLVFRQAATEGGGASRLVGGPGRLGSDGIGLRRRQRRHHLSRAAQPRLGDDALCDRGHIAADGVVACRQLGGARDAGRDEQPRGPDQRITVEVLPHGVGGAIGALDVGAGVRHEPHHAQVQEDRSALVAHEPHRLAGRIVDGREIAPVHGQVVQPRTGTVRGLDPARRGADADPEAVVFADEQER